MIEVQQTEMFARRFDALRDRVAQKRIARRIALLGGGYFGDVKSVGDRVSELRIYHGPGYRVYFARKGEAVILLLAGGDTSSQDRDIAKAKQLATERD